MIVRLWESEARMLEGDVSANILTTVPVENTRRRLTQDAMGSEGSRATAVTAPEMLVLLRHPPMLLHDLVYLRLEREIDVVVKIGAHGICHPAYVQASFLEPEGLTYRSLKRTVLSS